jgi:hypothetical protein
MRVVVAVLVAAVLAAGCGGDTSEPVVATARPESVETDPPTTVPRTTVPQVPDRILGTIRNTVDVRSDGLDCRANGLEPGEPLQVFNGAGTMVGQATTRSFTRFDLDGPRSNGVGPYTVADLAAVQQAEAGTVCYTFFELLVDPTVYETYEIEFNDGEPGLVYTQAEIAGNRYLIEMSIVN